MCGIFQLHRYFLIQIFDTSRGICNVVCIYRGILCCVPSMLVCIVTAHMSRRSSLRLPDVMGLALNHVNVLRHGLLRHLTTVPLVVVIIPTYICAFCCMHSTNSLQSDIRDYELGCLFSIANATLGCTAPCECVCGVSKHCSTYNYRYNLITCMP